jgi:hypothetical protein
LKNGFALGAPTNLNTYAYNYNTRNIQSFSHDDSHLAKDLGITTKLLTIGISLLHS